MHYYKRNLGDYAKKAGGLTMLEHGAYTLLIDACYDREIFPTLEQAIEWSWAKTDAEIDAVKMVLKRYFVLSGDGTYTQDRILQELLEYHGKADKNKQIAIERELKKKENSTNRTRTVQDREPNHKPITNNHKPLTNKTPIRANALDNGFLEFWNAYPKKVGKGAAEKSWQKEKPNIDLVLNSIAWQIESDQWQKNDGQFIPNPSTYINQKRWQDEPQKASTF